MEATAYSKTPLKQIGHVIAWHDERGDRSSGIERQRHRRIAKNLRKALTETFVERFNRGDYAE